MKGAEIALCFLVVITFVVATFPENEYRHNKHRLESPGIGPVRRLKRSSNEENDNSGQDEIGLTASDGNEGGDDGNESDQNDEDSSGDGGNESEDRNTLKQSFSSYMKNNGELEKLMSESTQLAQEVSSAFQLLTSREGGLLKEMQGLKEALNGAVITLKNSLQEQGRHQEKTQTRRQKRQFNYKSSGKKLSSHPRGPYKACVSLEPTPPTDNTDQHERSSSGHALDTSVNSIKTREFMPGKGDPVLDKSLIIQPSSSSSQSNKQTTHQSSASGTARKPGQVSPGQIGLDDVDLSQVYWLRLHPDKKQDDLHKKIETLLTQKQNSGNDVLVIPISHQFENRDQVKQGFMRAVRVRPEALQYKKLFRQLRSLQIFEL